MFNIKKKSKKSDIGTVKTGQIGPDISTANSAASSFSASANSMPSSNFKGADLNAVARLRSAKKKPLVGEVSLGETEVKEEAQAPRNPKYLERLRKRAK